MNFAGPGWLELDWKCPGRRPPTPPDEADNGAEEEDTAQDDEKDMAFDFEDEFSSSDNFQHSPAAEAWGRGAERQRSEEDDLSGRGSEQHEEAQDHRGQYGDGEGGSEVMIHCIDEAYRYLYSVFKMFSQCFLFNVNFYCFVSLLHMVIIYVLQLRS